MAKSPDPKKKPTSPNDPQPAAEPHEAEQARLAEDDAFAELFGDDAGTSESPGGNPASEVDLGRASGGRPPQPPSGQSSTIWADLVKDPSSAGNAGPADFDAPSDAEVIGRALGEDAEEAEEAYESGSDILGHAPLSAGAESSRVDLFDAPPSFDPLQSRGHTPQVPRAEDVSGLSAPSGPEPTLSDVNLYGEPAGQPVPFDSSINLGSDPLVEVKPPPRLGPSGIDLAESAAESDEAVDARESGIDLGFAGVMDMDEPSAKLPAAVAESGFDIGSAAVVEVDEHAPHGDSGIDIGSAVIVEMTEGQTGEEAILLDSGVDLSAAAAPSSGSMEGAVLIDSSSGLNLEGAAVIADEEGTELLDGAQGERLLQPSSDSDILIGADTSGAVLGGAMLLESPSSVQLGGPAAGEETPGMEFLDLGEAAPPGASESSVNLDAVGQERGSSRDLIAEAVESGVDLARADDGAILISGDEASSEPSSKVDLGGAVAIDDDMPAGGLSPDDLALQMFQEPAEGAEDVEVAEEADEADLAGAAVIDDDELAATSLESGLGEAGTEAEGNVDLGGAALAEDDSAEGTLEDKTDEPKTEAEPFADEFGAMADAEEEPAEDAEAKEVEEEEADRRPPPRPKYGRRWVGGTLVGMTLAAAACAAIVTFQPELAGEAGDKIRGLIGYEADTPADPSKGKIAGKKPADGGQQSADVRAMLKLTDFSKAPPPIDESSGDERAARGEYLWMRYVSTAKPPLNAENEDVKKALEDLKAASAKPGTKPEFAADARFWLGHIYETLKKRDEARKVYEEAADVFKADPMQKARFDGCLIRLEVVQPVQVPAPGPGAGASLPAIEAFPIGLAFAPAQQPAPPEAGFDFWKAVKLVRAGDYVQASAVLKEAKKKHEERRLTQIRKPQNPNSDPGEQIFEVACDQILVFLDLQRRLKDGKYLAADKTMDPAKALDALFADLDKEQKAAAAQKKDYDTLAADKKKADAQITTLTAERDKEKKDKDTALAGLKKTQDDLKAELAKVADEKKKFVEAIARVERLEKDKKGLEETIRGVGEKVDKVLLGDLDPVKSKTLLFQKLDDLVNVAATKDPDGRIRGYVVEVRNLTATLEQRWTPEAMLGYWTPLLADRTRKDFAEAALKDAERVKANAKAALVDRSHANAIEGLALRNQGDFVKARVALEEAVRGDVAGPAWKPAAKDMLKELTDPAASFLPRAEDFRAKRRYDEALGVLNEGLKVFPDKTGDLLALRSQVRLEKVLAGEPRPTQDTPGVKEALEDAESAIKAGAAGTGNFAAARLAEELAQRQLAEQLYRKAMAGLPETHPDAPKARLALSRMLLQGIEPKPAPEPMPKTSRGPGVGPRRIGGILMPDIAALVMGQLPSPEEEAKIKEAVKLADEVLNRPDIGQYPLLKAQALAVKGMWTQALNAYVQGLKPHLSREHHEGLKYLVDNHPLQRRPDVLRIPHPMQAEKHYAQGLTRFYNREYESAEKEFTRAVENFEQDARYHYFLGLARLAQGRLSAKEDFEQGAKLELDNRPSPSAVNAALERIQGMPRRLIAEARERVR